MRLLPVALVVLLAVPALAQAPAGVEPGTRVRARYAPAALPPEGGVFVGVLRSVGDTLVIEMESGAVLRPRLHELAGLEVSAGRRPFPYWLPVVGTAVGFGGGYLLGESSADSYEVCLPLGPDDPGPPSCEVLRDDLKFHMITIAGTALGGLAGAFLGGRLSAERWVPAGELAATGHGVSWTVRL